MKMLIDIPEETYNKMRRGEALYPADANVAIFAIEIGTPLSELCTDAISRHAVLDIVNSPLNIRLDEIIKKLPPVISAEKVGQWINHKCSFCGYGVMPWNDTPYCPNCGAKMQEVEE